MDHAMSRAKQVVVTLLLGLSAVAMPIALDAQARQGREGRGRIPPPVAEEGVSLAEIQRLFDAYVVRQAQQQLQLTDEQFPQFLARVKALQDARRRGQLQRGRLLQEMRRRLEKPGQDDGQLRTDL